MFIPLSTGRAEETWEPSTKIVLFHTPPPPPPNKVFLSYSFLFPSFYSLYTSYTLSLSPSSFNLKSLSAQKSTQSVFPPQQNPLFLTFRAEFTKSHSKFGLSSPWQRRQRDQTPYSTLHVVSKSHPNSAHVKVLHFAPPHSDSKVCLAKICFPANTPIRNCNVP